MILSAWVFSCFIFDSSGFFSFIFNICTSLNSWSYNFFWLVVFFFFFKNTAISSTTQLLLFCLVFFFFKKFNMVSFDFLDSFVCVHPIFFYSFFFISIFCVLFFSFFSFRVGFFYFLFFCTLFFCFSIFTGGYWSYSNSSWSFWWTWDPIELISIFFLLVVVFCLHFYFFPGNCFFFWEFLYFILTIGVVLLLSVRLGLITSRHSFFEVSAFVDVFFFFTLFFCLLYSCFNIFFIFVTCTVLYSFYYFFSWMVFFLLYFLFFNFFLKKINLFKIKILSHLWSGVYIFFSTTGMFLLCVSGDRLSFSVGAASPELKLFNNFKSGFTFNKFNSFYIYDFIFFNNVNCPSVSFLSSFNLNSLYLIDCIFYYDSSFKYDVLLSDCFYNNSTSVQHELGGCGGWCGRYFFYGFDVYTFILYVYTFIFFVYTFIYFFVYFFWEK